MIAKQRPTTDHYRRLFAAFREAYGVTDLLVLCRFNLDGFRNDDLDKSTIHSLLLGLFDWLDDKGQWVPFLDATRGDRSTNRAFVAVVDDVLAFLQTEPLATAVAIDPIGSVLLLRGLPFVGRQEVRKAFTDMDRNDGWCGIVLVGPKQVGKTYCHQYLAFLRLAKWPDDRLAQVILSEQSGYGTKADELAGRLILSVPGVTGPMPAPQPMAKPARWASDLAVWFANRVDDAGVRLWVVLDGFDLWVVLDGFDHPDVPDETHSFIATLIEEAANRSKLRVILLGYNRYQDVLPSYILPSIPNKPLSFLTADEIQGFFDTLDRVRPFRAHPQYAAEGRPADAFVQGFRSLPPGGDELRVKAVKELLPKVVGRLIEITDSAAGGVR